MNSSINSWNWIVWNLDRDWYRTGTGLEQDELGLLELELDGNRDWNRTSFGSWNCHWMGTRTGTGLEQDWKQGWNRD